MLLPALLPRFRLLTVLVGAALLLSGCPGPTKLSLPPGTQLRDLTPITLTFEQYLARDSARAGVAALAVRTNLEPFAIRRVQAACGSRAQRLRTYFSTVVFPDQPEQEAADGQLIYGVNGSRTVELPGVCAVYARPAGAVAAVEQLQRDTLLIRKHYFAFLCENPRAQTGYAVALIRAELPWQALRLMQTNATGPTEAGIAALQQLDHDYGLQILGADFDWCLVRLRRVPADARPLAARLLALCPDLADGESDAAAEAALARSLQRDPQLELWWD